MRLALCALVLVAASPQEDPFAVLTKPALRLKESERKQAFDYFNSKARDNSVCWAAARFLEKSDREWRLSYDRLTTKDGAVAGKVEGETFVTFGGQRMPVASGKLEKEALDPAAVELDGFLAKFWTTDSMTETNHKQALDALVAAIDKVKSRSEASEVLRLFALAHISALGAKAADPAQKLGLTQKEGRWGTGDQCAHYLVARNYDKPEKVDAATEAAGRACVGFGGRYAALLLLIHKSLAKGSGFESAFQSVAGFSSAGGPKGAADHLKALAVGFKAATYCKECKNGKITCAGCQGKKRLDLKCPDCGGSGRIKAPGDAGSGATSRCNKCATTGVLKNQPCQPCSQTGLAACTGCKGKSWKEGAVSPGEVLSADRCDACGGDGWPVANIAIPCSKCLGLGAKIKPAADPAKVLE
jgi:hypothetical protein